MPLVRVVKKPPEIIAIQYTGDNLVEFAKLIRSYCKGLIYELNPLSGDGHGHIRIQKNADEQVNVYIGDWFIQPHDGGPFIVRSDMDFRNEFEIVEEG